MAQLLAENLLVSDETSEVALFSRFWAVKSFRAFQVRNSWFSEPRSLGLSRWVFPKIAVPQNG